MLSKVSKYLGTLVCGTAVAAITTLGVDVEPSQAFVPVGTDISCNGPTLEVNYVATVRFLGTGGVSRCQDAEFQLSAIVADFGADAFATLRQNPNNGLWVICAAPTQSTQGEGSCPPAYYVFTLTTNSSSVIRAQQALSEFMYPITTGRQFPELLQD